MGSLNSASVLLGKFCSADDTARISSSMVKKVFLFGEIIIAEGKIMTHLMGQWFLVLTRHKLYPPQASGRVFLQRWFPLWALFQSFFLLQYQSPMWICHSGQQVKTDLLPKALNLMCGVSILLSESIKLSFKLSTRALTWTSVQKQSAVCVLKHFEFDTSLWYIDNVVFR